MCPPPFVGAGKTEGGSVSASIPHPFFYIWKPEAVILYATVPAWCVGFHYRDLITPSALIEFSNLLILHSAEMMSFEIKGLIAERGFSRLPALIAIDSITDSAITLDRLFQAHIHLPLDQPVQNRMHNSLFNILLYERNKRVQYVPLWLLCNLSQGCSRTCRMFKRSQTRIWSMPSTRSRASGE